MSIWMVIVAAGPVVLAAMTVGVAIALMQALTQVQEMTLTFVPKLIVVFVVFSLTSSFIGAQFYVYTERVYAQIERDYAR
jgi:flagellar biosynthetic protein FliQ